MIVVSDSTVLIGLAKIGKLDLLRELFFNVYIPEEVYKEVVQAGGHKNGAKEVKESSWLKVESFKDKTQINFFLTNLEKGEAEVLVLAKEMEADLLLMDEEKARKGAVIAGFDVIGVVGLLLVAKSLGLISKIKPHLEQLERKRFRISKKILLETLQKTGEA